MCSETKIVLLGTSERSVVIVMFPKYVRVDWKNDVRPVLSTASVSSAGTVPDVGLTVNQLSSDTAVQFSDDRFVVSVVV